MSWKNPVSYTHLDVYKRQLCGVLLGDGDVAAVLAVPCGYPVAPPELAGDAPVADVVHPVEVGLGEAVGHELDLAVLDDADGLLRDCLLYTSHADGRAGRPRRRARQD